MSTPPAIIPRPSFLILPHKPSAPLSYTYIPPTTSPFLPHTHTEPAPTTTKPHLIIFLNGLGLPASSWLQTLEHLLLHLRSRTTHPAILTYDRFGQGLTTSRDPIDGLSGKELGHDYLDVVGDLHVLVKEIVKMKMRVGVANSTCGKEEEGEDVNVEVELLIIAHSIGCNLARLYTQHHPGLVSGLLLLDTNLANASYSTIFPLPSSPSFSQTILVNGECTLEEYMAARAKLGKMFDFDVVNAEGLDRRNSGILLPDADAPRLKGSGGRGPLLCVVAHDPVVFEDVSWELSGTPRGLTRCLTEPYWKRYNEQLRGITDEGRCGEVVVAEGCGHFIQRDDPVFVARQVVEMLDRLHW